MDRQPNFSHGELAPIAWAYHAILILLSVVLTSFKCLLFVHAIVRFFEITSAFFHNSSNDLFRVYFARTVQHPVPCKHNLQ